MKPKTTLASLSILILMLFVAQGTTPPQTAFTYQGQLRDGSTNANGSYSLTFKLFDAVSAGTQIGSTLTVPNQSIVNGLFTVALDFGGAAFEGNARWLEITVQSLTATNTLAPRVALLPTPHAISANKLRDVEISYTPAQDTLLPLGTNGFFKPNGINLPAPDRDRSISANTNGITVDGIIIGQTTGIRFPAPGGRSISADSQGILVDGISISSANGIILPAADRNRSIRASTQGITLDDVIVGNARILLPSPAGNRTIQGVSGGVDISHSLNVFGNVSATAFNATSDRNLKEQITAIDSREILERVARLPISTWNFKQDAATRHIGPMAQDFHAAFKVGPDDKHIATVDADGVALAAIQGLHSLVQEKDAQIADLKKRLETLEKLVLKQNEGGP